MDNVITVALIGAAVAGFSAVMQYVTITAIKRIEVLGHEIKQQTNGLTQALVKVTSREARAAGKREGAAEQKAEDASSPKRKTRPK